MSYPRAYPLVTCASPHRAKLNGLCDETLENILCFVGHAHEVRVQVIYIIRTRDESARERPSFAVSLFSNVPV